MSHLTLVTDESTAILFVTDGVLEAGIAKDRLYDWVEQILGVKHTYAVINRRNFKYSALKTAYKTGAVLIALGNEADKSLRGIPHFKLPHPNASFNSDRIANELTACKAYLTKESK